MIEEGFVHLLDVGPGVGKEVGEEGESSTVQNQLSLVVTSCHYVPYCSQSRSLEREREEMDTASVYTHKNNNITSSPD